MKEKVFETVPLISMEMEKAFPELWEQGEYLAGRLRIAVKY